MHKEDSQKKTSKFPKLFINWGCRSFKRPGEMAIINSIINAYVYIEILDNFLILSIENWFDDMEVIFQNNYASCHRAKRIKAFLQKKNIKSTTLLVNSPNLNPIENL